MALLGTWGYDYVQGGSPAYRLTFKNTSNSALTFVSLPSQWRIITCKVNGKTRVLIGHLAYLWANYSSNQDTSRYTTITWVVDIENANIGFGYYVQNTGNYNINGAVLNLYPNATNIAYDAYYGQFASYLKKFILEIYKTHTIEFGPYWKSGSDWLQSQNAAYIKDDNNQKVMAVYEAGPTFLHVVDSEGNNHFVVSAVSLILDNITPGSTNSGYYYIGKSQTMMMMIRDLSTNETISKQITDQNIVNFAWGNNKIVSSIETFFPDAQSINVVSDPITYLLENFTSFHSDPVYVEATKLKYTDGTYNFIRGVANADRARKAAYNSLLRSYGTFYKGTEEQLSNTFAKPLESS